MGNQRTFASMAWQAKGKVTRRERFLAEMDTVIPYGQRNGRAMYGSDKMSLSANVYWPGVILVIFDPSRPTPPIKPF